eukprot:GSChrysophyteH1.ASY1.ANO1.2958.1 assembled CDS
MGQGQEAPAEANLHLMQNWLPDFRCFVSAEPPSLSYMKNMPESLMQSSVKVANEAPSDIKSNIFRGWANFSGERWSRKYSFNTGDLTICANVLEAYLEANETVPWDDLRYIFGEIMYGGHITDAWDRRTCANYLSVIMNEGLHSGMELGPNFKSPDARSMEFDTYIDYTDKNLPQDSPQQFGLHPNAEIGYLTNWTQQIFDTILVMGGGGGGGDGGDDTSAIIKEKMKYFMDTLPDNFQMIDIMDMADPLLEGHESGPYVMVAVQECQRMNGLMTEIRRSLVELEKGMKGQLNMSTPMEDLMAALIINQWPGRNPFSTCQWEKKAWPSMKNAMSEFLDMIMRIDHLKIWAEKLETPFSVWLSGLFNPTSYITAVMQVTARKTGMPLDQMTTDTHVTTFLKPEFVDYYPEDGAFVHGLYIEGARWPTGTPCAGYLVDSRLKELLPPMPVMYVKAVAVQKTWEPSAVGYLRRVADIFECPIYLTSFRGATYVFLATLKTVDPNSKWVLTGTAILMQTD